MVPSDETLVVEKFRDEIGDWRLCVLSPFGGRVHAAWGLAVSARIRDELDLEADAIWSDDGIVIHLPDADEPPDAYLVMLEPDEVEDLVVRELGGSALFGARFRENAARSLLIPRAYPGKRTPLWQQRLKSQSLLEVAKDFPRFPVILETYRECLRDVLDLPALIDLLRDLHSRKITLVEVETQTASPFASSLLFDYVATYMYEGDTPNAERRAAALALDRDLLSELLGADELRELIDPEALEEVERSLQLLHPDALAKDRDALQQVLRRLGDLTRRRAARGVPPRASRPPRCCRSSSASGARSRSGSPARSAGSPPRTRASIATRSACRLPAACPTPTSRRWPTRSLALVRRYARTHGPFPTAQITRRFGARPDPGAAESSSAPASSFAASCCPGAPSASGATPTCCAGSAAPASPRCARRSRRSIRPSSRASCPPGRTSTPTVPPAPGPIGCARRSCRSRGWR